MPNQFRSVRNECQGTKLIKLRRFAKRRNRSTLQTFLSEQSGVQSSGMATRPMPSSFTPPCSLRNVFAVRPQPVIPPRSVSVHVIPLGRRKRDHFPKPFRNNALFATLAIAHNASCATLSRTMATSRRARPKGDSHEEYSAAAD